MPDMPPTLSTDSSLLPRDELHRPTSLGAKSGVARAAAAAGAAVALLAVGCAAAVADLSAAPSGWVRYRGEFARMDLRGRLELPAGAAPAARRWPVVIIAHGSAGVDGRGAAWGEFLRQHGIATFEIDYFGPRNIVATSREQPSPTVAAVGLYPPCAQLLEVDPDPALPPLLIQVGSADEIALAPACERIAAEGAARG